MVTVHKRVVIDIESGRVLERESFEYDGPVAEAKGGGGGTTTTSTALPEWLQPYAQQLISQYQGQAFDENGNIKQAPDSINQQVAGFNPNQMVAMNNIANMTGGMQGVANSGLGQTQATLNGAYLDPNSNPYLSATYDKAARKLTDAYSTATAPSLLAAAQKSGNFGGSAMDESLSLAQRDLGSSLGDLGTSIYGGNYANERTNQLNTLGMLPNTLNAGYTPQQALLGVGAQQQQQEQSQMDTNYQNAVTGIQYPYELLSGFGGALGQAGMGAGTSTTHAGSFGGK